MPQFELPPGVVNVQFPQPAALSTSKRCLNIAQFYLTHFAGKEAVGVANSTSLHGQFPLLMDQAYLTFISNVNIPLNIYENNDMCENCKPAWRGIIKAKTNYTYVVSTDTTRTISLEYQDEIACQQRQYFVEYGDYYMHVEDISGNVQCSKAKLLQTVPYEANEWPLPLNCIIFLTPKLKNNKNDYNKTDKASKPAERLISLDVFRGVTICLTIFGNAGAGSVPYFYHNVWHGMNLAELPHGWFIWMLGMGFSIIAGREWRNVPIIDRLEKGFRRAAIFFFFGLVVNSSVYTSDVHKLPYFGVLQGMGVLNLFVLCMDLILTRKRKFLKNRFLNFFDFGTHWPYYLIIFIAVAIHNAILFGLHVPGCGRGYLGPGGLHMYSQYKNCTGGAAGYIDRMIIGEIRIPYPLPFSWHYGTSTRYDPYGPFQLIGQLVQVYLGVLSGEILLLHKTRPYDVYKRWFCIAVILSLLSWLLCNDTYCILPCNRRLCYLTLTHSCNVGLSALILFAILHYLIDVKKIWNGWPIYYWGRNSLFTYVGHLLTKDAFPFAWPTPQRHMHFLIYMYVLYRIPTKAKYLQNSMH
uniref:DUF5009 domain-containing protein n=1 Tax=Strigamia maritima TaxID=126957 RepID=T1J3J0_STRMM